MIDDNIEIIYNIFTDKDNKYVNTNQIINYLENSDNIEINEDLNSQIIKNNEDMNDQIIENNEKEGGYSPDIKDEI